MKEFKGNTIRTATVLEPIGDAWKIVDRIWLTGSGSTDSSLMFLNVHCLTKYGYVHTISSSDVSNDDPITKMDKWIEDQLTQIKAY